MLKRGISDVIHENKSEKEIPTTLNALRKCTHFMVLLVAIHPSLIMRNNSWECCLSERYGGASFHVGEKLCPDISMISERGDRCCESMSTFFLFVISGVRVHQSGMMLGIYVVERVVNSFFAFRDYSQEVMYIDVCIECLILSTSARWNICHFALSSHFTHSSIDAVSIRSMMRKRNMMKCCYDMINRLRWDKARLTCFIIKDNNLWNKSTLRFDLKRACHSYTILTIRDR